MTRIEKVNLICEGKIMNEKIKNAAKKYFQREWNYLKKSISLDDFKEWALSVLDDMPNKMIEDIINFEEKERNDVIQISKEVVKGFIPE